MSKSTRKLLCFLLAMTMSIGITTFLCSVIVRLTVCNQVYIEQFIYSNKIDSYCDELYNQRIEQLSDDTGIPVQVFELGDNRGGYDEVVVSRFFEGSDTSLFTKDKINTYENLIKEYLDGNEYSYSSEDIHTTAVKAAKIYGECYGINDVTSFGVVISRLNDAFDRVSSIGLGLAAFGAVLIFSLFTNKKEASRYCATAMASSGISMIILSLVCLVTKVGRSIPITPVVYRNAISSIISVMFVIVLLAGAVITTVAELQLYNQYRKAKKVGK